MNLPPLPVLVALSCAFAAAPVSTAASSPAPIKTTTPVKTSAPVKTAVPTTPSDPGKDASGQTIYDGNFQNGWQYWGWAQGEASCPSPALSVSSLKVQEGAWQAVYLHHDAQQTAPGMTLSFWINGGKGNGQSLVVAALRNGVPQPAVPLPALKPGRWQQVQISLPKLGIGEVSDFTGLWIWNFSNGTLAPFYVDKIAISPGAAPAPPPPPPAPPAAPGGLSAAPVWAKSCPICGGMAMAHIVTGWNTVAGASSYTVYRNGVKQINQAAPGWTDMGVTSGHLYSYTVSATGPGGEGAHSASVSQAAPMPPAPLTAPTNLSVLALWQNGTADALSWTPVAGAASYNVYQSDVQVAHGLTVAAFTVPPDINEGNALYTVTAVDGTGTESLPSAVAGFTQAYTSGTVSGCNNYIPAPPDTLVAVPDWNGNGPRVVVSWHAFGLNTFNVYRDGAKIASGIWREYYVDTDIQPGSTHSYTVAAQNNDWLPSIEGSQSEPIIAAAPNTAPAMSSTKVQITKVVPNDDSVVVFFAPVAGAADYRIYDAAHPAIVKYAGQITQQQTGAGFMIRTPIAIQWNGIDPSKGANLVVQAVDKLGPFQKMDGSTGDGTMNMGGMSMAGGIAEAINGQGDPSNVPNVLAQSDPYPVTCVPFTLSGDQVFQDNFRSSTPLVKQPNPAPLPGSQFYGSPNDYAAFANDKWEIREYGADLTNTKIFMMGSHFMDTLYDGGGLGSSTPSHNNNASLVMVPKATADISGGKVLHVTFEVDAHMDGRRWCELMVGEVGDPLIDAAKFDAFGDKPTVSGKLLRWQIEADNNNLQMFLGDGNTAGVDLIQPADFADGLSAARTYWDHTGPLANGTLQDLDKRHRFDLYLSKTHYRIEETTPDGLYNMVREKDFPAGVSLPFDKCQVYFVHQLYHTSNDVQEVIKYQPFNSYWPNFRPYSDERHWDDLGLEVLNGFPHIAAD